MRITCEHCGTAIDIEKDRNCPHCGAPYSKNKEYSEAKDYKKKNNDYDLKEREVNIHSKELQNQVMETTLNSFKKVSIVSIIIPIIFFIIFAAAAFFIFKGFKTVREDREQRQIDKYVTIGFNENASTSLYDIKCDAISEYEGNPFFKSEDKTYYAFHIVYKNKTKKVKNLTSLRLTYTDDKGNEDVVAERENMGLSSDTLVSIISEEGTYTGNVIFEVPNYVTDVKIKYEVVTIDLKDFKNKIITE